jgi:hypothetical protein
MPERNVIHLRNLLDKAFELHEQSRAKLELVMLTSGPTLESAMAVGSYYEDNHRTDC